MWGSVAGWLRYGRTVWQHFRRELDTGQGLVEYALILIFVATVMVVVMAILGPGIANVYSNIVAALQKR